jgi:hypothetical protein
MRRTPSSRVTLADCLKVNASELRFGITESSAVNATAATTPQPNMQDREMFGAFLSLPADRQRLARELIYALKISV